MEENIESLIVRMKKFSYKPYPGAQSLYPKRKWERCEDSEFRHLKTKWFKVSFKEILEAIYEPKFKEFSYGFRPNRELSRRNPKGKQTHHGGQGQLHSGRRHQGILR